MRAWLVVVVALTAARAHAEPASTNSSRPAAPEITTERYGENYAYLRDPANRSGVWWERLKYIPLGEDGGAYVTLGDDVRFRYERYWENEFGSAPKPDEDYLRYRQLPYVDLHVGSHLRAFAQLMIAYSTRSDEVKNPFTDETGFDLVQGFAELSASLGTEDRALLRVGRQVLIYGSGRLLNAGPNIRTAFDGVLASARIGPWTLDAFVTRPVEPRFESFNDRSDPTRRVWAGYVTRAFEKTGIDLYYIGFEDTTGAFEQGEGEERRHTFGARWFGAWRSWSWDHEAAYQSGDFAGGGIHAWGITTETRYTFSYAPLSPWLGLRATALSGDHDQNDETLETFNAMFPPGGYFGETGVIGPSNLYNLHPAIGATLSADVTVDLAVLVFWRQSLGDGIYGLGGQLLRENGGSRSRYFGTQPQIAFSWGVTRHVRLAASYGVLFPGAFIRDTGIDQTVHFVGGHVALSY